MAIDLRGGSSVLFYNTFSAFPATGSTTTLYVDRGDMVVYIWNGSSYDQLNNGSNITTVANYSALLAIGASNVPNMFYWCSSSQGTSWLPGSLGGTYYNSGLYYSNGTSWEYMNSPYQATQAEVNAGIVADKFVTPSTFYNSSKWGTKEDSLPSMVGNSLKVLRVNTGETGKEWATVSGGASNPSVVALDVTDGATVTGTTVDTLSKSMLIPANTFSGSGMLEIITRAFKTGSAGNATIRIYLNTSSTLTGATLIATLANTNTQFFQSIRNMSILSNSLSSIQSNTATLSDFSIGSAISTTTFTVENSYFLLFAIQLANSTDSAVIKLARSTKYI
jgi:hypothetical protein